MGQITVPIGGARYVVGCRDGEEQHVNRLVKEVERRLNQVRANLSPVGEGHALFLTTLLLADELYEAAQGQISDGAKKTLRQAEDILAEKERNATRLGQLVELAERLVKRVDGGEAEGQKVAADVK
ncbi:cell division protein ZapA [Saccharibacter sp. 17.LH.SD]|uniref:cell division protein ZapA n=1 Tax=Saccharibacter sp. 17.LH.SD TaxID=2689393 RepID=UPI00136870CD|nr:cell division protein ZapA [Saccharibacter sp. 17.LH.SD]MXV43666.1 cell division protein ZapA [Saccharibacter sp. 17.LH.SD]